MIDFSFTPGQEMLQKTARAFAQNELAPRAAEIDKTEQFPRDLFEKMTAIGFTGICVPEEYGGSGGTDIDIHSTSIISSIAPEAMVCTMPWLFSDYQAAEDAFFGAGGEYMTELLSTKGVTYLGAVHNGFKLITNSKHPIEQPEDLAGLKIRIPGGDFFMDFYTAYGASPQAMSWSEVFTALQQGTIDGHDNSISTIVSNNVQEIQPYMTVSRHTYEAFTWMANTANFTSKLSEEDQQLVFDLVEQACKEVNAELVAEEEELIAQCEEENGVQFYRFTDEDVETWRAVISDLIEEYKGVYGEAACTAFGVQ